MESEKTESLIKWERSTKSHQITRAKNKRFVA
jgi:hypothetical protein